MAMKKKPAAAHPSPTKGHHISKAIKPTLSNTLVNALPAAPSLVSNAMTSTIGWAKDETDRLLELEYKEEIFQYMKQMEKETMAVPEHMDLQPELTWDLRPLLVDFLIEIHSHFNLQPETLYLAMNMMDRYLSKRVVYKKHFQLVGMTSLWISSKYEDAKEKLPSVSQLCKLCSNAYDEAAFITMERHILKTLDYNLGHPTAEAFLKKDLEMSGQNNQVLRHVAQFLMELTIFQRCFLSFGSSTIAASALFLARSICRKQIVIPSDPNVFTCIQFLDNSLTNVPKIVHEKYALPRLSRASIVVKEWVDNGGRALVQPISTTECPNPLWTLSNMLWQPPSPIPTTFPTQAKTGNSTETQTSTYSHSSYASQHAHAQQQQQQQQQPPPPQKQPHRATQQQPSHQTHPGRHHSQSVSAIVTQYVASHQHHRTGSSVSAHQVPYSTLPQQPQPAVITHQTTYDLRPIGSDCGTRWVDINVDM
ncbi:hypothetical protein BGZ51_005217 [Haplosporangium sp. Z 767]|nr:hypothetical protein BGZ51_005217 [Haplosporangium sp. Z 767]KAF9182871.1 hypothetical protein BGZ50_004643 [Haplosporangium sp. Z 11]